MFRATNGKHKLLNIIKLKTSTWNPRFIQNYFFSSDDPKYLEM